jgi:outer membrane protein TolC
VILEEEYMFGVDRKFSLSVREKVAEQIDRTDIFRILLVLALITLMALILSDRIYAQQEDRPVMEVSLKQAMQLALEKNFDVQISSLDTESAYASYLGSTGVYDFFLQENFSYSTETQRQYSTFSASERDNQGLRSTFGRKFFTGAEASVNLNMARNASNSITASLNPQYVNTLTLDISQPLLKNFGRLATEQQIVINKNNMKVSEANFETQVINTIVDVQARYWALVSAYESLKVARDNLELAQEQLEINRVKVRVGTLPEIDIIQAEQNVAASESALLDAEILVQRAEDSLKNAIVMDDWNLRLEPTDKLVDPAGEGYDFMEAFETALENRPEVKRLNLSIENNDVSIKYAKNQLKPVLNLSATIDLTGAGGTFVPSFFAQEPPEGLPLGFIESFSDTFSGENRSWSVGAIFRYTFGNNGARAVLMANEVAKKQNELRKEQLRFNIAVEVRNAIREVEASAKQLEARRKTLEFAQQQYEAEKQKFDVGTSTNFEVLSYQNGLLLARLNVNTAQIRYNNALIVYDRAIGAVMEKHNIQVQTSAEGVTGAEMR